MCQYAPQRRRPPIKAPACTHRQRNVTRYTEQDLAMTLKCKCASLSQVDIPTHIQSAAEENHHIYENIWDSECMSLPLCYFSRLVSQQRSDKLGSSLKLHSFIMYSVYYYKDLDFCYDLQHCLSR